MRGFDTGGKPPLAPRAGFDAVFITDHNSRRVTSRESTESRTPCCPGIEVSAWRAHIVLLGDTLPVDRSRYNGSLERARSPCCTTSDSA